MHASLLTPCPHLLVPCPRGVQALEDIGQLDNTYIFYTGDNGYKLGHHRLVRGWAMQLPNVPMLAQRCASSHRPARAFPTTAVPMPARLPTCLPACRRAR